MWILQIRSDPLQNVYSRVNIFLISGHTAQMFPLQTSVFVFGADRIRRRQQHMFKLLSVKINETKGSFCLSSQTQLQHLRLILSRSRRGERNAPHPSFNFSLHLVSWSWEGRLTRAHFSVFHLITLNLLLSLCSSSLPTLKLIPQDRPTEVFVHTDTIIKLRVCLQRSSFIS